MKKSRVIVSFILLTILFILKIENFETFISNATDNTKPYVIEPQPSTLPFPVTIRDFNADYIFFETMNHVYGQDPFSGKWLEEGFPKVQSYGMVENKISQNKKPIINDATIEDIVENLYTNYQRNGINYGNKIDYINIPLDFTNPNPQLVRANNVFKDKGTLQDAKEFYKNNSNKTFNEIKPTIEKSDTRINTAYRYVYYYVNRLFLDTEGLNIKDNNVIKNLTLTLNNGIYTYNHEKFLYLDGKGFNQNRLYKWVDGIPEKNWIYTDIHEHNYNFTLESHTRFWFDPDEMQNGETLEFEFSGDDDVWIYIDGKLVIDIGGKHEKLTQSITINKDGYITNTSVGNTPGAKLESVTYPGTSSLVNNVTDGSGKGYIAKLDGKGWYDFDFFFIERHSTESNFNISTSILFNPKIKANKEAYIEMEDGTDRYLNPQVDTVFPGDIIYYKIGASNDGNLDLNNIRFVDDNLKLEINENGVFHKDTGEKIIVQDLQIIKLDRYGNEINPENPKDFSKLSELGMYESIYIKSKEILKYKVTNSDLDKGNVSNKATVYAKYEDAQLSSHDEVMVNVNVYDIVNPKVTIKK